MKKRIRWMKRMLCCLLIGALVFSNLPVSAFAYEDIPAEVEIGEDDTVAEAQEDAEDADMGEKASKEDADDALQEIAADIEAAVTDEAEDADIEDELPETAGQPDAEAIDAESGEESVSEAVSEQEMPKELVETPSMEGVGELCSVFTPEGDSEIFTAIEQRKLLEYNGGSLYALSQVVQLEADAPLAEYSFAVENIPAVIKNENQLFGWELEEKADGSYACVNLLPVTGYDKDSHTVTMTLNTENPVAIMGLIQQAEYDTSSGFLYNADLKKTYYFDIQQDNSSASSNAVQKAFAADKLKDFDLHAYEYVKDETADTITLKNISWSYYITIKGSNELLSSYWWPDSVLSPQELVIDTWNIPAVYTDELTHKEYQICLEERSKVSCQTFQLINPVAKNNVIKEGVVFPADCSSLFAIYYVTIGNLPETTVSQVKTITIEGEKGTVGGNITNMSQMFKINDALRTTNVFILESIDIAALDTSHVTDMSNMFEGLRLTKGMSDLSNFNTQNVTTMEKMFYGARISGWTPDFSRWNTSKVEDFSSMFSGAEGYLTEGDNVFPFDTSSAQEMECMFGLAEGQKISGNPNAGLSKEVTLDISSFTFDHITDMQRFFSGNSTLTTIILPETYHTAQVTDMSYLFSGCAALTEIRNFDQLDTSGVENMEAMFSGCESLETLDLSHFNTAKVTNMKSMFQGLGSLTSLDLDLSGFITSNVTNMSYMFQGLDSLTTLDLDIANFDTSKVTDMSYMFKSDNLTQLKLGVNFNTEKVTDMSYMFNMKKLEELDISVLKTGNVTDMSGMFALDSIKALDISHFDMTKVKYIGSMICLRKATSVTLGELHFDSLWSGPGYFYAPFLEELDLSGLGGFDVNPSAAAIVMNLNPYANWNKNISLRKLTLPAGLPAGCADVDLPVKMYDAEDMTTEYLKVPTGLAAKVVLITEPKAFASVGISEQDYYTEEKEFIDEVKLNVDSYIFNKSLWPAFTPADVRPVPVADWEILSQLPDYSGHDVISLSCPYGTYADLRGISPGTAVIQVSVSVNGMVYSASCNVIVGNEYAMDFHTAGTEWKYDDTTHWHECTVCGEKLKTSSHIFIGTSCRDCGCSYKPQHIHTASDKMGADEEYHFYICKDCGEDFGTAEKHTFVGNICSVCNYDKSEGHTHHGAWKSDAEKHWQECEEEGCGEKVSEEAHKMVDGKCKICGYEKADKPEHTHTPGKDWKSDASGHWQECTECKEKTDAAAHDPADGICKVCGYDNTRYFTVTVAGSLSAATGAGNYKKLDTVKIDAGAKEGYLFIGWTSGDVTFADALLPATTFVMPEKNVTVTANWKEAKDPEEVKNPEGEDGQEVDTDAIVEKETTYTISTDARSIKGCVINGGAALADKAYNGSPQTQNIKVTLDGQTLKEGTDYRLVYTDNINAGSARITVQGIGSYKDSETVTFKIKGKHLGKLKVIADTVEAGFADNEPVHVFDGTYELVRGEDYDYDINQDAFSEKGTKTIELTALPGSNYEGTTKAKVTAIELKEDQKLITSSCIELSKDGWMMENGVLTCVYDGTAKKPDVTVTVGGEELTGKDYSVSFKNNKNAGTAYVIVKGKGKTYRGQAVQSFVIKSSEMSFSQVIINKNKPVYYTGSLQRPNVAVKVKAENGKEKTLAKNKDYTVSYKCNMNAGAAYVTITGLNNYEGICRTYLYHIKPADITKPAKAIKKASDINLKYSGRTLLPDVDYKVTITDSSSAGKKQVTVEGIGNFTGSYTKDKVKP